MGCGSSAMLHVAPSERLTTAPSMDTEHCKDTQAAGVPQTTNDDSYIHAPIAYNTSLLDFGPDKDRVMGLPVDFTSAKEADALVPGGGEQGICADWWYISAFYSDEARPFFASEQVEADTLNAEFKELENDLLARPGSKVGMASSSINCSFIDNSRCGISTRMLRVVAGRQAPQRAGHHFKAVSRYLNLADTSSLESYGVISSCKYFPSGPKGHGMLASNLKGRSQPLDVAAGFPPRAAGRDLVGSNAATLHPQTCLSIGVACVNGVAESSGSPAAHLSPSDAKDASNKAPRLPALLAQRSPMVPAEIIIPSSAAPPEVTTQKVLPSLPPEEPQTSPPGPAERQQQQRAAAAAEETATNSSPATTIEQPLANQPTGKSRTASIASGEVSRSTSGGGLSGSGEGASEDEGGNGSGDEDGTTGSRYIYSGDDDGSYVENSVGHTQPGRTPNERREFVIRPLFLLRTQGPMWRFLLLHAQFVRTLSRKVGVPQLAVVRLAEVERVELAKRRAD